MKRYPFLLMPLLAATATPALATEGTPAAPLRAAIQRQVDSQTSAEQTRQSLTRLREALEARKQAAKQAVPRGDQETESLCSDCPDKEAPANHHSVSEERKIDCIECVEQAVYA